MFIIFGALAEFELNIIRERTSAGLAAARARGKLGGRPKSLDSKQVATLNRYMRIMQIPPLDELCKLFGVSPYHPVQIY